MDVILWCIAVPVLSLVAGFAIGMHVQKLLAYKAVEPVKERVLRPVQEITEARLQEMFAAAPDAPLWKATLAVIDAKVPEVTDRAIDAKLSEAEVRFHLGGAAALIELKDDLLERERVARQMQAEREQETKQGTS